MSSDEYSSVYLDRFDSEYFGEENMDTGDLELDEVNSNDEDGYGGDSESDSFEKLPEKRKRGRGRPKGSLGKRPRVESSDEDIPLQIIKRMKKNSSTKRDLVPVSQLAAILCCASLCLTMIPVSTIETLKEHVGSLSKSELSQWVLDWLWTHPSNDGDFCFLIGEWTVCLTSFLTVIGMPLSTYYTIRKRYSNGQKLIGRQGVKRGKTSATEIAVLWIHDYAMKYAEKQPDQMKLHLPPCLTKACIYETYAEEINQEDVISLSHFYWVWRNCASHVTIPANSRLSKCNICIQIKTQMAETKDKRLRSRLQKLRDSHLTKQSLERRKYYKHIVKARKNPDKYLSIIIDGMDQAKTELPHFLYLSSLIKGMWKLRTHLIGAIVHGVGVYGFFDYYQYPHSSNLTLHVLTSILFGLEDLPDVLYLQMDNCARENKNKYIFAFLCYLVEKKIFKKIKISFLMVGHTHEDIDQVFSRFSNWLNKHSAKTLPALMEAFEKCFSPAPQSIETDNVFDITGWLQDSIDNVCGHSQPHSFKIYLDENNRAKMVYKKWANDKVWLDSEGTNKYILKGHPVGEPSLLKKNDEKIDIDRLKADVEKVHQQYACNKDGWWTKLFEYIENGMPTDEENSDWFLKDILLAKESQRIRQESQSSTVENVSISIHGLSDEENVPVVTIGKPQKAQKNVIIKNIAVGQLCLLNVGKYAGEWPQMAKIVQVEQQVTIQWMKGSRSGPWTPCTIPEPGVRGKRVPWTETVTKDEIWYSGFELTNSNKLPKKVLEHIDNFADF